MFVSATNNNILIFYERLSVPLRTRFALLEASGRLCYFSKWCYEDFRSRKKCGALLRALQYLTYLTLSFSN